MIVYLQEPIGYENFYSGLFTVKEMDPDNHEDWLCELCCFEHWFRHAEEFSRQRPCVDYNLPIKENEYFEIIEK